MCLPISAQLLFLIIPQQRPVIHFLFCLPQLPPCPHFCPHIHCPLIPSAPWKPTCRSFCRKVTCSTRDGAHASVHPISTFFFGKCLSLGFRFQGTWLHDALSAIFRGFLLPQQGRERVSFSLKKKKKEASLLSPWPATYIHQAFTSHQWTEGGKRAVCDRELGRGKNLEMD
jgi:hypothetical protein